jgi:galactose mutarotase-like enzyme
VLLLLLLLQGYPGTLETSVRYELLSHSAELRITISATTDKATPGAAGGHNLLCLDPVRVDLRHPLLIY